MRFTPDNLLYLIKQIVTGANSSANTSSGTATAADGGIKHDVNIPLPAVSLISGTTLTTDDTAQEQILSTAAAASPGMYIVQFVVPRDYDEASDHFNVNLFIADAAADAGITVTGTPTVRALGAAPVTGAAVTAVVPFTTPAANLSTTEQKLEITFSGLGLVRDSIINVVVALVGTTTGAVTTWGIEIQYDSTIVSFNDTDINAAAVNYPIDGFGNPLR
jgi:hypothetical protein